MTLQQIVSDYFAGHVGKFLEIGANDCNVNYDDEPCSHLLEEGWYGLYCEPNPFSLVNLIKNTQKYNAEILCAAVAPTSEIKQFYTSESHPYLSSLESTWIGNALDTLHPYFSTIPRSDYQVFVNTITPKQIFEKFGYDFDCISIDIELYPPQTHMLLKKMDFEMLNAKMVIVEGHFIFTDEYMEQFGFTKKTHKHNSIYTR